MFKVVDNHKGFKFWMLYHGRTKIPRFSVYRIIGYAPKQYGFIFENVKDKGMVMVVSTNDLEKPNPNFKPFLYNFEKIYAKKNPNQNTAKL